MDWTRKEHVISESTNAENAACLLASTRIEAVRTVVNLDTGESLVDHCVKPCAVSRSGVFPV